MNEIARRDFVAATTATLAASVLNIMKDSEANSLLTKTYRAGYELPDIG